jgi:hypothetical protein
MRRLTVCSSAALAPTGCQKPQIPHTANSGYHALPGNRVLTIQSNGSRQRTSMVERQRTLHARILLSPCSSEFAPQKTAGPIESQSGQERRYALRRNCSFDGTPMESLGTQTTSLKKMCYSCKWPILRCSFSCTDCCSASSMQKLRCAYGQPHLRSRASDTGSVDLQHR